MPCANCIVWYGRLVSHGLLTNSQANALREIYVYNPLLADFVLKRVIRFKDAHGKVSKFGDKIFQGTRIVSSLMEKSEDLLVRRRAKGKKEKEEKDEDEDEEVIGLTSGGWEAQKSPRELEKKGKEKGKAGLADERAKLLSE